MSNPTLIDVEFLRELRPLGELDAQCLQELLPLFVHHFELSQATPDTGDWSRQLVYLVKGELKVQYSDGSTTVLVGGSEDTRQPLGKWGQTLVSAKAINDIELLCLDEEKLEFMLIHAQLATQKLQQNQLKNVPSECVTGIADASVSYESPQAAGVMALQALAGGTFNALPLDDLRQLLRHFQRIQVRRGDTLVRQDEEGDYYYLIEAGRCLVTRLITGTLMTLAELKAGDAFGEEALLTDLTRNATVTMKTDGILLRLAKKDFVELLRSRLLQKISYAEAWQRAASGAIWLDVRFAAEHQYDGIHGSRNISLNTVRELCASLDLQQEYIVYCQNGRRSAAAAFLLAQRGFRASLLEGGLYGDKGSSKEAAIL
ncbi:MAG TPA: cyclic nucleotide-binding domain-containing protein [Rhodocyclaceae bacterium]|nr:cyclic nucleotide-binding domain-containing protein [Rhodocyclaceae bacterium]